MMELVFSKIKNCQAMDIKLSIFGTLLVLLIDFLLLSLKMNSKPVLALVLLSSIILFSFCIYYFTRTKTSNSEVKSIIYTKNQFISSSIIFFLFIFFSLLTILGRSTIYERPILFFICISLALLTIAIDIFFLPIEKNIVYFTLFKIILVAVILRWVPLSIIPGLYGDDPMYHQMFTLKIMESHYIPQDLQYSEFPLMHLVISSIMIVTGMNFKYSTMFSVTSLQAILVTVLIYLLAYAISLNYKYGLVSSFIYSFSDMPIGYGILGAFPTTFAILLSITIVYLLFKLEENVTTPSVEQKLLIVLLSIALILSHSLTALFMTTLLLLFYFYACLYKSIFNKHLKLYSSGNLVAFFLVVMFAYWIYKADFIFIQLLHIIFMDSGIHASFSTLEGKNYAQVVPISVYFFSLIGQFILYGLSVIGSLYAISNIKVNSRLIIFAVIGLFMVLLAGIGQVFGLGIAADRLGYYVYFLLPFSSAFGFLYLISNFKFKFMPLLALVILVMSFFMITNLFSNIDTPLYDNDLSPQRFLKVSEIQSIQKITSIVDCDIGSDNDLISYIRYQNPEIKEEILNFYSGDFSQFEGAIIIRDNFRERPIYSRGLYKPRGDVYISLQDNSGFNLIFSSEILHVFSNK